MQRGTLIAVTVVASWMIPAMSFAAAPSGTGSSLSGRMQALRVRVENRIPASTGAILPNAAKQKAWDTERKRHEDRLWELRSTCREELRKANRDTITEKAKQCYRSDLMEEIALRRKEQAFLTVLPGLDTATVNAYAKAVTDLTDAEVAIVDGIDTDVYDSLDALQTAKRRLRDQYRSPYWTAYFHLQADRLIPGLAWQVDRMALWTSEEPEKDLSAAVQCLEESVNLIDIAKSADSKTASEALAVALGKNRECAATLRGLVE